MRRLLLLSALALAAGAGLLRVLQHDAGYVLIVVGDKTVEMRFWFAVIVIVVLWLVAWLCKGLLSGLWRFLTGGWRAAKGRRQRKIDQRAYRGLIHFIEGNWYGAKRDLLRSAKVTPQPLVHYLAAARSAYELGESETARELLLEANKFSRGNELAVALSQARLQLLDKRYEPCLATLNRAKTLAPHHPVILRLLHDVYLALQDWRALAFLLPELVQHKVLPVDEVDVLEERIYFEQMRAIGRKLANSGGSKAHKQEELLSELDGLWHRVPKLLKNKTNLVVLYCGLLINHGQHQRAEKVLGDALKKHRDDRLIELYGLVQGRDYKAQLQQGQAWLQKDPENPHLLLALGRISLRNELWGQAKDYFQYSLKLQPLPATYAELARLHAYLGEHEKSTELYQAGLLMTTNGLPNLPMPHLTVTQQ